MSDKRRRRRQNSEGSEHSEGEEADPKESLEELDLEKDEGVVSENSLRPQLQAEPAGTIFS